MLVNDSTSINQSFNQSINQSIIELLTHLSSQKNRAQRRMSIRPFVRHFSNFSDPYDLDFFQSKIFLGNAIHSTFFYVSLQHLYHISIPVIARIQMSEYRPIFFLICVISGKLDHMARPLLLKKMCSFG